MKHLIIFILSTLTIGMSVSAQKKATITEYRKTFTTYGYSDPDPIPHVEPLVKFGKIYPYFRFDGYASKGIEKEWKVVELENDYIKVIILPEIGGKVWAATEKSTGQQFIYYNHVVKFRDIAIRGPWTSGGIEYNYGVYGHSPNCSTPVDYTILKKEDGSVSCIVGALDLFTRTTWCLEINLPCDKAYFSTSSFWYNSSSIEQPYYTWMNSGIKSDGNLQFIYPGTKWIEHSGGSGNWPINEDNRDISFYNNNDFGGYKSYHVFGEHTDFFGGYWHDDDFGTGRYSTRDDKAGKKIWIWGLSEQGMIWEKLLTDNDGQYVELQSGRLFNQTWPESTFTPFKHKGFLPHTTDLWKEYWFPVLKTKGFVVANEYGALNLKEENGWLKIYFSPLQDINDSLIIKEGEKVILTRDLSLKPLEVFSDSVPINVDKESLWAIIGDKKLEYSPPSEKTLERPVTSPADFDWNSIYGLYLQGKEKIRERQYIPAEEKIRECLAKDPNYLPALTDLSLLLYQKMQYKDALITAKRALSIDTYDPAANYYYGIINSRLGNMADAKDGFEIASMGMDYRSASFSMLSELYLKEMNLSMSVAYAKKSIDFNRYAVNAYQLLAVNYRLMYNKTQADKVLDTIQKFNPLSHFTRFERYLWDGSEESKKEFTDFIKSELPHETYLEIGIWYYNIGRREEAVKLFKLAPQNSEILYWLAFLTDKPLDDSKLDPAFVFPFRQETGEILENLIHKNQNWLLKYHLALIHWNLNNIADAGELFSLCGNLPGYSPFYAARAAFYLQNSQNTENTLADIMQAIALDNSQWRHGRYLISFYLSEHQYEEALTVARQYYTRFPDNYYLELLYAKALLKNKLYSQAERVLEVINLLPNEGATEGRKLYKENKLMLALEEMKKNNYRKALKYIHASRQWPENLGVGKPYETDIDERLEDWLSRECNLKLGNKIAAQGNLNRILEFKPQKTAYINTFSSANNLISAWALQLSGDITEAEAYLQSWIRREPSNSLAIWAMNKFKGIDFKHHDDTNMDENYRILNTFLQLK